MEISDSTKARFWAKVQKTDTCWLWRACKIWNGYGQFGLNGKVVYAHRLAYELLVEDIPEGKVLDHQCHVRNCVNPAHLRVCSQRENTQNRKGKSTGKYSSKYPGVNWDKQTKKWVAYIRIKGKSKNLGYFLTEEEAAAAYQAACPSATTPPAQPIPPPKVGHQLRRAAVDAGGEHLQIILLQA